MTQANTVEACVPAIIRYGIASSVAAGMLFAGIALAGAGHGWVAGGFGCFALAPISFVAWANALSARPSRRGAFAAVTLGLVACVVVSVATTSEGLQRFFDYWRAVGIGGALIAGFAYFNWLIVSVLAIRRAQRSP